MMVRKKYVVAGMKEWHTIFKVGRSKLHVSFTGGHLCGGAFTPASYVTTDPVIQKIIESSDAFKSERIKKSTEEPIPDEPKKENKVNSKGNDESPKGNEESQKEPDVIPQKAPSDREFVFEYDNEEDIYEFLQNEKGVPVKLLCGMSSCFAEAQKLGIILKKKESSDGIQFGKFEA